MPRVNGNTAGNSATDIRSHSNSLTSATVRSGFWYNPPTFPALAAGVNFMDPVVNQLARDLGEAISAAVAEDARVEACLERAREAGYDLKISLEASIGVASRAQDLALPSGVKALPPARPPIEMTTNDRRFLKSLRISADEPTEKEVE